MKKNFTDFIKSLNLQYTTLNFLLRLKASNQNKKFISCIEKDLEKIFQKKNIINLEEKIANFIKEKSLKKSDSSTRLKFNMK